MPGEEKRLCWIGAAYAELRSFPESARHLAGYELGLVQEGKDPEDWKPMESVGHGAREIRIRTHEGGSMQHRVIYVAKFHEAVYVLHAFQKKTQATSQHNLGVARVRYAQMLRQRQDPRNTGGSTR